MHIRRLMIRRYRGLLNFNWEPAPGVNCIIGPGDSKKSTVLAAISLLLAPYAAGLCSEFDYYNRRVADGFEIEAWITVHDLRMLAGERSFSPLQGWLNGELVPLPDEGGADPILVVRVRGTADMEAFHEILPGAGDPVPFSVGLRKKLMLARLSGEDRAPRDLRAGSGSLLDRFLGRTDMRAALHRAISAASAEVELPAEVKDGMARLSALFRSTGLPEHLHLGIVPLAGTTLPGMVTLLNGTSPTEAVPIAMAGTGTRHLALLELSSALAGNEPVIVVDEPERGLEPYRQRLAAHRVVKLADNRGHAFITTHAPTVLRAMPAGAVWRMRDDAAPAHFVGETIQKLLQSDPEAFFAPLPIFCEGATEVGLLETLLPDLLGVALDACGAHLVDGGGQPNVFPTIKAFADAGITIAAFLDNETSDPEIRARLGYCSVLFVWAGVCNIEEAVARHLPLAELGRVLDWAAEARGIEQRYLADQIVTRIDGAQSRDLQALVAAHGEPILRDALYAAMNQRHNGWFKGREGGRVLARGLREVGIPAPILGQLTDFARRASEVLA